jgi:hypothetical protein
MEASFNKENDQITLSVHRREMSVILFLVGMGLAANTGSDIDYTVDTVAVELAQEVMNCLKNE